MRDKLLKALCSLAVVLAIVGCGSMQKAIKTGDPEIVYGEALRLYEAEKWSKAYTLFESVDAYFTGTMREDTVTFFSARCKYKNGEYYTAMQLFDDYRREFGRSEFIEDAEGMLAMCHYYVSPGPTRDQSTTQQAINAMYEFMARYPESDKIEGFNYFITDLQGRLYEKSFINAYTYYKIGRYKSSIVAFRNALKEYPESTRREDLSYYVVASSYELAENSVASKQADRYMAMLDSYFTFVSEFPESDYIKDVEKMAKDANKFLEKRTELQENIEQE